MSIKLKDTIYDLIDNADKLDGVHNGNLTAKYFAQGDILTSSDTINKLMSGIYCYINANNPTGSIDDNAILLAFRNSGRTDMIQFVGAANSEKLYYRRAANIGNQYENWTDWKTIAFIDSKVNSAGYADSAGTANSVAWGNVSGKPSSFTPSSHTHTKSQITDFAHTHDYAATSHTHTKAQITDFSHTHNYAGSSSAGGAANAAKKLELVSSGITTTTNDTTAKWGPLGSSIHFVTTSGQLINQPSQYGMILNMTNGSAEVAQLGFTQNTGTLYHRQGNGNGWGCNWTAILDTTNYSTWVAAKSHTHDYAASGHNHDSVYSKLSHTHSYAASNHNHDSVYSKLGHTHDYAASSHSHDYAIQCGTVPQSGRVSKSGFYETSSATTVTKNHAFSSTYMHFINCQHSNTTNNYALQIAASFYDNVNFKIRVTNGSDSTTWNTILHNNNWSSYCAAKSHTHDYAASNHTHSYAASSHTHNYAGSNSAGGVANNAYYLNIVESGTVANTWGSHGTKSFIGGWASTSAGFSRQYGTTLNISGYSTWYHRLAFTTFGEIEHWMGINTTTLSRVGYLAYTYQIPTSLPANGGNADTTDNHHFSTVSSLPSSPNSSTVYFIV